MFCGNYSHREAIHTGFSFASPVIIQVRLEKVGFWTRLAFKVLCKHNSSPANRTRMPEGVVDISNKHIAPFTSWGVRSWLFECHQCESDSRVLRLASSGLSVRRSLSQRWQYTKNTIVILLFCSVQNATGKIFCKKDAVFFWTKCLKDLDHKVKNRYPLNVKVYFLVLPAPILHGSDTQLFLHGSDTLYTTSGRIGQTHIHTHLPYVRPHMRHMKKQPLTLKVNDVASAVLAHMRAHIYT